MQPTKWQIGLIGLGKMGLGLYHNLVQNGYQPIAYDVNQTNYATWTKQQIKLASQIPELVSHATAVTNLMFLSVPAGHITNELVNQLLTFLPANSIIVDTGNTYYLDSIKNYELAKAKQVAYVDCGTSGGPAGAKAGACMMVGGEPQVIAKVTPILQSLCVPNGFLHTGQPGSGHFCKMVHNGIEYGMMQALAEGFHVLQASAFSFDLAKVAHLFNHGSVIRSWLTELLANLLTEDKDLQDIAGVVAASGEATWTVQTALEQNTPTPVIAAALFARQASLHHPDLYANKLLAALRNKFGGHPVVLKTSK